MNFHDDDINVSIQSIDKEPLIPNKNKKKGNIEKPGLNFTFLKRLWRLFRISTRNDFFGYLFLIALVLLCGASLIIGNEVGDVISEFYSIIVSKDMVGFNSLVWKAFLIVIGISIVETTIKTVIDIISVKWRKRLVRSIEKKYLSNRSYYSLLFCDSRIDNPDQRITQDVEKFTVKLVDILRNCIDAPLIIIFYAILCLYTTSWYSPLIVVGYWLIAFLINKFIMTPNISTVFAQERLEGDYRYRHLLIRRAAESISFYGSEGQELNNLKQSFKQLLRNRFKLVKWNFFINGSSSIFDYAASIVNYVVVALPVFYGSVEYGTPKYVSLASFRLLMLINGFTKLNILSKNITDFAGYTSRLGQMYEVMDELKNKMDNYSVNKNFVYSDEFIELENVTIYTPKGDTIIKDLSFKVSVDDHLLIVGKSGSGKTTILRTIGGVWNYFEGIIRKPMDIEIVYLSQTPHIPFGNLYEQICYPYIYIPEKEISIDPKYINISSKEEKPHKPLNKEILLNILKDVDLSYLWDRYIRIEQSNEMNNQEWTEILSPGEIQRLCLARVLYHKPKYAIMDESTSSIDSDLEKKFYSRCKSLGITCISVSHKDSLKKFHNQVLKVKRNGNWSIKRLIENK